MQGNNKKYYPNLDWQNAIFEPVHLGEASVKEIIPNYAVTESDDIVLLKQRIDIFIEKLNTEDSPIQLFLSPKYFSAIEEFIVNRKYRGLEVVTEDHHPKNLIYAKSKYHK